MNSFRANTPPTRAKITSSLPHVSKILTSKAEGYSNRSRIAQNMPPRTPTILMLKIRTRPIIWKSLKPSMRRTWILTRNRKEEKNMSGRARQKMFKTRKKSQNSTPKTWKGLQAKALIKTIQIKPYINKTQALSSLPSLRPQHRYPLHDHLWGVLEQENVVAAKMMQASRILFR